MLSVPQQSSLALQSIEGLAALPLILPPFINSPAFWSSGLPSCSVGQFALASLAVTGAIGQATQKGKSSWTLCAQPSQQQLLAARVRLTNKKLGFEFEFCNKSSMRGVSFPQEGINVVKTWPSHAAPHLAFCCCPTQCCSSCFDCDSHCPFGPTAHPAEDWNQQRGNKEKRGENCEMSLSTVQVTCA